jgi:hypothetical protein
MLQDAEHLTCMLTLVFDRDRLAKSDRPKSVSVVALDVDSKSENRCQQVQLQKGATHVDGSRI